MLTSDGEACGPPRFSPDFVKKAQALRRLKYRYFPAAILPALRRPVFVAHQHVFQRGMEAAGPCVVSVEGQLKSIACAVVRVD